MKRAILQLSIVASLISAIQPIPGYSQQLVFCDSVDKEKLVGQSSTFNIEEKNRIVTLYLYNGNQTFGTSKIIFKFYEAVNDSVNNYLTRLSFDINPEAHGYWQRLPFNKPDNYKVEAYTAEGKFIASGKLTITAAKQTSEIADFSPALLDIVNSYPQSFNDIKGQLKYKGTWESTKRLPGLGPARVNSTYLPDKNQWQTIIYDLSDRRPEAYDSAIVLKAMRDIEEKIDHTNFECCVLKKEEMLIYDFPPGARFISWKVVNTNSEKDRNFSDMKIELHFMYPLINGPYYLSLNINPK